MILDQKGAAEPSASQVQSVRLSAGEKAGASCRLPAKGAALPTPRFRPLHAAAVTKTNSKLSRGFRGKGKKKKKSSEEITNNKKKKKEHKHRAEIAFPFQVTE